MFQWEHTKKRQILFHRFSDEYTLFLPQLLLFLKGVNENWVNCEKWVGGGTNFLENNQCKRGGEQENTQFVAVMGCCCFNLLTNHNIYII